MKDNVMDNKSNVKVNKQVQTRIPTRYGDFDLALYSNSQDDKEHLVLLKGDISSVPTPLVRLHSECFTGDVIGSLRCDCGEQLELSMQKIAEEGAGAILYLRQEGRGIGLLDKLRSYNLQDSGVDTVDANILLGHEPDARDYSVAAQILSDLGIWSVRLMTNNPEKIRALNRLGIEVQKRVPLQPHAHPENTYYLLTKARRMEHMLNLTPLLDANNRNGASQIPGSNGNGHH